MKKSPLSFWRNILLNLWNIENKINRKSGSQENSPGGQRKNMRKQRENFKLDGGILHILFAINAKNAAHDAIDKQKRMWYHNTEQKGDALNPDLRKEHFLPAIFAAWSGVHFVGVAFGGGVNWADGSANPTNQPYNI